jgi:hypothetical protein
MSRSGHPLYLRRCAQAIEAVNAHDCDYGQATLGNRCLTAPASVPEPGRMLEIERGEGTDVH